jgi:hypothetical protein
MLQDALRGGGDPMRGCFEVLILTVSVGVLLCGGPSWAEPPQAPANQAASALHQLFAAADWYQVSPSHHFNAPRC